MSGSKKVHVDLVTYTAKNIYHISLAQKASGCMATYFGHQRQSRITFFICVDSIRVQTPVTGILYKFPYFSSNSKGQFILHRLSNLLLLSNL